MGAFLAPLMDGGHDVRQGVDELLNIYLNCSKTFAATIALQEIIITAFVGHLGPLELSSLVLAQVWGVQIQIIVSSSSSLHFYLTCTDTDLV